MSSSPPTEPQAAPDPELPPSPTVLDKALAALLAHKAEAGQGALLVQLDDSVAWLALETAGVRIALWAGQGDAAPDQVIERFKAFVKSNNVRGADTFFVLVGGDEVSARAVVRAAKPRLEAAPLGFYHLASDGTLTAIARRLPWLEAAAAGVPAAEPLDEAAIEAHLMKSRAVARQQAEIAGKLRGRYGVTAAITAVCVVLFLFRFVWADGGDTEHLLRMGASFGPRVRAGEIYRLFAAAFLHANIVHLGANMLALWSFGPMLEALLGPRRYLVLYGTSALVGSVASAFLTEPRVSVGASGAVWGLMTAGIAVVYRPQGLLPESMLAAAKKRAWAPLALNLIYSFQPGIDFLAHLGGGAAGFLLLFSGTITRGVRPLASSGPESRRAARSESPFWTALAGLMALAMAASVIAGFALGKPWKAGAPPAFARTGVGDTGVTLELPEQAAASAKVDTTEKVPRHRFGTPGDPIIFDALAQPLEGQIAPEALEAELEALRAQLETATEPGVVHVGPASVETVGGRRAVVHRLRVTKDEIDVTLWHFVIGPRLVVLRAFILKGRPKGWAGVEDRVAASIQAN